MPSQKGKGCPVSQRCQAASKSDDATLAQKRVYWRNKKREQRARLSEKRSKSTQDGQQEHQAYVYVSPGVNARLSDRLASSSLSKDVSCSYLSKSGKTGEQSPTKPPENQEWSQTMTVSKVLQPTHSSVSARAADDVTVKYPGLAKSCGSQLNTSLSVPQVRVTRITSNCSTKTEPKPCGSMQSSSEAEVKLNVPRVSLIGVTADTSHGSSNCPVFGETAVQRAHATPQSGTKSALVTNKRASGFGMTPVSMESEEERAAKRREQWRIKKREQRAKLAKARERPQSRDRTFQGLTAQKTRVVANSALLTSQSYFGSTGPKQTAVQVKVPYTAPRLEADKLRSRLAVTNLQTNLKKEQSPQQHTMENTAIATFDVTQGKTSPESQIKPIHFHHRSNISQGIASCKMPRQRPAETHKSFLNQRNLRSKPPSTAAMFRTRAMPKMDPNDTPEQILAKRREYWRNKKREQRAKLSLEKKIRLKEKDSLTRRVKRYQQILEEMRKARALVQSTERVPLLANEAIGGFIEEDGTLTVNIPESQEEKLHALSKTSNWGGVSPTRVNPLSLPALSSQGKLGFSPAVQTFNKTSKRLNVKTWSDIAITANSGSKSRKSSQQLTLTHFQSPHNEPLSAGSKFGGCVMKMNISNHKQSLSALSGGTKLTEEERTAKKREYWRTKKREQRAARAFRLKQSVFQARSTVALLRRKAQTPESPKTERLSTNLAICEEKEHFPNNTVPDILYANEIKQEDESAPASDLNSLPVQAICPDIKLPTTPPAPPVPQLESEPQPSLNADSQATTLLVVASMKKLLEESLSTVSESQTQEAGGAFEAARDTSEQDKKPVLSTVYCENNEKALVAACVPSKMESLQLDSDILKGKDLPTPPLKDLSQIREAVQSLSTSGEPPHSLCDQSSQTSSTPFVSTASSRRTQRSHSKNWADQNHSFDEPPKLHHITTEAVDPPQLDQQSLCHNSHVPLAERYRTTMRHTSSSSLQKKREYWKLMKRQQRAKLKARQKELLSRNTKVSQYSQSLEAGC
ncbi:PREDICTED: uncharacterized protein LOC107102362 [Cyprinodon variegatus]|uniref:uncharacterized protein LOC107102362 n=1 Tax=Cyprinodon variegatus TaxID=28743 RepID=UPI00074254E1|nr:PREDICTED: uncharacterized protein LOC107102362 [Cyprinodon variegatus]